MGTACQTTSNPTRHRPAQTDAKSFKHMKIQTFFEAKHEEIQTSIEQNEQLCQTESGEFQISVEVQTDEDASF